MPAKIRRRADVRISRGLSRTTTRAVELRKYLETCYGPTEIITDFLRRIANT